MTIRPTRHALVFLFVLGAMFLASINYQSNAAWLMVFLVFTTGCMSAVHGLRNVLPATVEPGANPLVPAGDRARLPVTIGNRGGRELLALAVEVPDAAQDPKFSNRGGGHRLLIPQVGPHGSSHGELILPPFPRGVHRIPHLRLSTQYPLGLFRVTRSLEAGFTVFAHPTPAGVPLAQMPRDPTANDGRHGAVSPRGQEDFRGLRAWQVGESYRQIDWKAAARSEGPLQLKDYAGGGTGVTWLAWSATAGGDEQRLSQLAQWVLEAHQAGLCYGLRLPGTEIVPATGVTHRQECLRALAGWQSDPSASGRRPAVPGGGVSGARSGAAASVSGLPGLVAKSTGQR